MGETASRKRVPGTVFQAVAISIFGLVLVLLLLLTAPRHGPWFDEFWSRFFSDPSIPLAEAFFGRWVQDVHPPLFSFLARLAAGIDRLSIEHARLLNLAPLLALGIYLVMLGRAVPRERPFLAVLAISVGSSAFFIEYFSEFRSYFTGLCAFTGLTVTLIAMDRVPGGLRGGASPLLWCGYLVSLAVCLNIHYLTTAMSIILVAVFGVAAFVKGDRCRFVTCLVTGIVATAPFLAFLAYQWATIARISADYWLKTDMPAAARMLVAAVAIPTMGTQGAVAFAWLAAALLFLRSKNTRPVDGTIAVLMIAIVAEIVMLLIYTKLTAAMTERYLIPLAILSAALFAIILSRQIYETRWLLVLFILTNLGGAVLAALPRWNDPRWDEAARHLAQMQKACPGSRIIPMQQNPDDRTPNTLENYNEAYAYMAQKWGLSLGPVDTASSRPQDPVCVDYYWADHFFATGKSNDTLLAEFARRWPALKGCSITVTTFSDNAAIFDVTGDPPHCAR